MSGNLRQRDLFIVDQAHDQDDRATLKIAEIVSAVCEKMGIAEPFAMSGRPDEEILRMNRHLLPRAAVLMSFGSKGGEKFSKREHELIEEYVRNGGHLLVMPVPPEKPPNSILENFGAVFGDRKIVDEENHAGRHNDHIIVRDFSSHPINTGINAVRFGKFGCYPIMYGNLQTTELAWSSSSSEPPRVAVATESVYGMGKVFLFGQTRLFQDDFIKELDNEKWFTNIITYLCSERHPSEIGERDKKGMLLCIYCGIEISEGDKFCGSCGQRI